MDKRYRDYPAGPGRSSKSKRRPAQKNKGPKYAFLFMTVIFAGIIVIIAAFALAFSSFSNRTPNTQSPSPTGAATSTPSAGIGGKDIKEVCLVKSVDANAKSLVLYNIEGNITTEKTVSGATEMKDKYGGTLLFTEFKPGDVVEIAYPENGSELRSIRQSPQAQTFANSSNITVNAEAGTISLGNNTYNFNEELVCMYKGNSFDVSKVDKIDILTLRTYKTAAVYLEVVSGHGVIKVPFSENIMGATLEVDTNVYTMLDEDKSINVAEGTHKIVIKGDNIETYIRELYVLGGETVEVDLDNVQIKAGVLTFSSNVDNVSLTVNGSPVAITELLVKDYGEYVIKATKDGYEPFETTVDFHVPTYEVKIEMSPVPTPTPRPEKPETVKTVITTDPSGADIYIDGYYSGQSPLTVNLTLGNHEIEIIKSGYTKVEQPVTITEGMLPTFNFTLQLQTDVLIP